VASSIIILIIIVAYAAWVLVYWFSRIMLIGSDIVNANAGTAFSLIFLLAPVYQSFRLYALPKFLAVRISGNDASPVVGVNWLISLFTAVFVAYPLANMNLLIRYFGSLHEPPGYSSIEYGAGGHEGAIFLAIVLAVLFLADFMMFWVFTAKRAGAFKRSLFAALAVNAVIYGAVITGTCLIPAVWYLLK
jgi:hypothetical protein